MIDTTPPDPRPRRAAIAAGLAKLGGTAARRRGSIVDALWLFATSAHPVPRRAVRIRARQGRARLARDQRLARGRPSPGTAYVLLHDHASESGDGGIRAWGFVRGGIGRG